MSPFLIFLSAIFLLPLSGCSFVETRGERTSVEAILRQSATYARILDEEERSQLKTPGRTVVSLPPQTLHPPLAIMRIGSRFGAGRGHEGVDLPAPEGTPIAVALDGIVAFSADTINGYGLTVIVRHARGLSTLYAHASQLFVVPGERVFAGQQIASVGETGNASGPHLHFELRNGLVPTNPVPLLFGIGR